LNRPLVRRVAPFAGAALLPFLLAPLPPSPVSWTMFAAAAAVAAVLGVVIFTAPWRRLPTFAQAVPPLAFFAVIGLLRAAEGGSTSAYGAFVLLPIFWLALYGTVRELTVGVFFTFLVFAVPIVVVGEPQYPMREWERALVWLVAGSLVAVAVHRLVRVLRDRSRALQTSEERLKLVIDNMSESLIVLDEGGKVVLLNAAAAASTRLHTGEGFTAQATDAVVLDSEGNALPPHEWPLMRALRGEALSSVITLRRPHLPAAEREIAAVPLPRGGALAVTRDISARRRAERYFAARHEVTRILAEARDHDEELWASILAALATNMKWGEAATFWQFDGERLRCRASWHDEAFAAGDFERETRELALAPGQGLAGIAWESRGTVWLETAVAAQSDDPELSPRREAAAAAGIHGGLAFCVRARDERFGVIEFFSCEPQPPDPELMELSAALAAQIGQWIESIVAERDANRLKEEFVSLVSHELRTPLTSVIGYLELLLDGEDLNEEQRRYLGVIQRNAERLLSLISELLLVAQIQAGKLTVERRPVELERITREHVEDQRRSATERGVELHYAFDSPPPTIGDETRLGQIVDNLVSNAIKFTPAGGRVTVDVFGRDDEAVIEVADTGIGIPSGELRHVFERFFRSSSAQDAAIPGTGLGLSLTKALVDAQGGRITVESEEGSGTTFRVALPVAAGDRQ